jgi:hypothetical protein
VHFLDGGEPGVETSVFHLLLMVTHGRWWWPMS